MTHLIPRSQADLLRRHAAIERMAGETIGLMGRSPDYLNVTLAGFAGRADTFAGNGNEAGGGQPRGLPPPGHAPRLVDHPRHRQPHGRPGCPRDGPGRRRGGDPQGGRDGRRHRRARRPGAGHAGPVRRRDVRLPRLPAAGGRPPPRALVLGADGHAGPQAPLPRQLLERRPRLRPALLQPVRRAGRGGDLRRRRGAAGAGVHRRRRRHLQLGDDPVGLDGEHHAADDDPGPDQAPLRLGAGHPHGPGRRTTTARWPPSSSARSGPTSSSPGRR